MPPTIRSTAASKGQLLSLWNRRFVEIYTETPDGRPTVDYGRIADTEPALFTNP